MRERERMEGEQWRGSQDVSRCPLRNVDSDLDLIIWHNALFCDRCRDEEILERTKGEEVLFASGAPYWALLENVKGTQKGKQQHLLPLKVEKEARRRNVPTGIALHRLAKQGFSKDEALQKYVEKQREKAAPKSEDDKVQVDREKMPWAPSFPKILKKYRSVIQRPVDHQRYVAIVANFLNANHSQPRFQQNRQEVRIMDEKLEDERRQYQELVLRNLCSRQKSVYTCGNQRAISYVLDRLRARASSLRNYGAPIFDEEMKDLVAADALTVLTKKAFLYRGKVPKIILPNERLRFTFTRSVEEISARYPPAGQTQYPLESDELAVHLAIKYGVSVVMCSSSALKILCNPWIADSSTCLMPVVVKRSFSERTNRFENVCLVGKPCVEKSINGPSLWRRYLKFAVKLAIYGDLKKEADEKISAKTSERQRSKCHTKVEKTSGGLNKINKDAGEASDNVFKGADPATSLIIDEAADNNKISERITSSVFNEKEVNIRAASALSSSVSAPILDDILGDIMNEMGNSVNVLAKDHEGMEKDFDLSSFDGTDPCKRFTLFSLGHDGMQDVDLIIRSNNDGIDTVGNELSIVHKIEYAAEFGAERVDDEEWLHDYFCCKLKCASQLVRLRIHHLEQHLLQKERYNENMLTANRPDLRKLAEERTQWLKRIVGKLESLQPGNYLIRKETNRLQILPATDDTNNAYLTEEQLKQLDFDERLPPVKEVFRGIDEHLVLVYHIVQKRIPASFGPKKDGIRPRNPGKQSKNVVSRGGGDGAEQSGPGDDADDIFGAPVAEDARMAREGAPSNQQSKRHGKRNRPGGRNFRGGSRTTYGVAGKRPRFVDFDAPQMSQK